MDDFVRDFVAGFFLRVNAGFHKKTFAEVHSPLNACRIYEFAIVIAETKQVFRQKPVVGVVR